MMDCGKLFAADRVYLNMIGKLTIFAYLVAAVFMPLQAIACDMSMQGSTEPELFSGQLQSDDMMPDHTNSGGMPDCHKEKTELNSEPSCLLDCSDCSVSASYYTVTSLPIDVPDHQVFVQLASHRLPPHESRMLRPPIT